MRLLCSFALGAVLSCVPQEGDINHTELAATTSASIYGDALASGWEDWSWTGSRNLANTSPVFAGTRSIAASYRAWDALSFFYGAGFNTTGYAELAFQIHGGTAYDNARMAVRYVKSDGTWSSGVEIAPYCAAGKIVANQWTRCKIPLSAIGLANTTFLRLVL